MKKIFKVLFVALVISTFFHACQKDSTANSSADGSNTGQGGSMAKFAIQGNYMYKVEGSILKVYDVSNVSNTILLNSIDLQLTQLLTVLDVGEPTPQPVKEAKEEKVNNTLGNLLGTLKSILPVKQMVAMWFQTEMITDPDSIYYSPNFGPDAWLEHDKNNRPATDISPV